ncbi:MULTISPECIES: helix-turn-helix domain-containing protein [Methylobacterium]|uniref:helix-turn-helix domain-containing protein n=1 Tax=Methylobacterium TaxID=407 RepID=UPI002F339771
MRLAADDPTVDEPELSAEEWAAREAARRRRDIGEIIARQRAARRLPVRRLAIETGVSESTIRDLEAGAPTDVGDAVLVAEALGLDLLVALRRAAGTPPPAPAEIDDGEALPAPGD